MDREKAALLFGVVPSWADPDDPRDRVKLFSAERGDDERFHPLQGAVLETLARQIDKEEPPETWQTARRLLGMGLDRRRVLADLALALTAPVREALQGGPFDSDAFAEALGRLPLPEPAEVEGTMRALVEDWQPIPIDTLEARVGEHLGIAVDEEPARTLVDDVFDRLIVDEGPLALLPDDRVVEPVSLCGAIVLTHRMTEAEREAGVLTLGADLAGFWRPWGPLATNLGCDVDQELDEDGLPVWRGPDGWLERFTAGTLLAGRCNGASAELDALDAEPPPDPEAVDRLRAAYDAAVEEPGLPVSVEDLVLGMVADDRGHSPRRSRRCRRCSWPPGSSCEATGSRTTRRSGRTSSSWSAPDASWPGSTTGRTSAPPSGP